MQPTAVRHSSPRLGRRERVERGPHPQLEGIAHRYCGYWHEGTGPARRREVAQDQVTIILGFGPELRVSGPNRAAANLHCFVAPLHPSYAVTEKFGTLHGIQVDLSPLGAHMLLGEAMDGLSRELVIPLDELLGGPAGELVERLAEAPAWEARFAILDDFIAARVARAGPPSPDVSWAWRRLRETSGRLPITTLTAELGCSNRHLVTRFHEQLGLPLKTVSRLLRSARSASSGSMTG